MQSFRATLSRCASFAQHCKQVYSLRVYLACHVTSADHAMRRKYKNPTRCGLTTSGSSDIVQRKDRAANFFERQPVQVLRGETGGIDVDESAADGCHPRPML